MIKRKIFILTLTFLFFVSTTGLPLVLHYCEMMESVSFEICEMHNNQAAETPCCESEKTAEIYFTSGYDNCCSTKLVDSSVKDNFVVSKSEIISKIQLPVVLVINLTSHLSLFSSNNIFTDASPPPLIDNHLYLTHSILLI
jgi:hypothetical protein